MSPQLSRPGPFTTSAVAFPDSGELRSGGSRLLAAAVWGVCALAVTALVATAPLPRALVLSGLPVLLGAIAWAAYWTPRVDLSPAGMSFVNVLRSVEIPWPAVEDFDLRFGLAVRTAWETKESAWSMPQSVKRRRSLSSPGGDSSPAARSGNLENPGSRADQRPDQPVSSVLDYHHELVTRGFLDSPVLERPAPLRWWNLGTIAVLVVALLWALAAVMALALGS